MCAYEIEDLVAKFINRAVSPNLMLAKVTRYMVFICVYVVHVHVHVAVFSSPGWWGSQPLCYQTTY